MLLAEWLSGRIMPHTNASGDGVNAIRNDPPFAASIRKLVPFAAGRTA
jgi:hypothetical protein